jgi:hypothetical protein
MPDLFEITLADGIPVAGDGDVKTINSLMEDGALTTIGNMTDPANGSVDALPASVVAVLKNISLLLQQLRVDWPDSLGVSGGLKIDGSGTPLPISGTVNITQSAGAVAVTSFTCGTTAYAANDVVGAGGGNAAIQFVGIAPGAVSIQIISATLEIDRAAVISGETTYRLYLYNVTPPSALADSAIFDLSSPGDRSAFLGYIDFPALIDLGSTLYIEVNNLNKVIKTASASVFGYLVSVGPFTPTAALYKLTLGARQL